MKTPREILLNRHQAVKTKLDRIRRTVVAEMTGREMDSRARGSWPELPWLVMAARTLWHGLVLPARRIWAGLAAVWVAIVAMRLATGDTEPPLVGAVAPPSPETIAVLRQQQQLLAELIGPLETSVAERPDPFVPRPRSERREDFHGMKCA